MFLANATAILLSLICVYGIVFYPFLSLLTFFLLTAPICNYLLRNLRNRLPFSPFFNFSPLGFVFKLSLSSFPVSDCKMGSSCLRVWWYSLRHGTSTRIGRTAFRSRILHVVHFVDDVFCFNMHVIDNGLYAAK